MAQLTERQAFEVMVHCLEGNYASSGNEEIDELLSDLLSSEANATANPAAWERWMYSVQAVAQQSIRADLKELLLYPEANATAATVSWNDWMSSVQAVAQQFINTDKLQNLLRWTGKATEGSEADLKPAVKRLVALTLYLELDRCRTPFLSLSASHDPFSSRTLALCHTLDRARALSSAHFPSLYRSLFAFFDGSFFDGSFLSRVLSCSRTFETIKIFKTVDFAALSNQLTALEAQIPSKNASDTTQQAFINQIVQLWYIALALDSDCLNLSGAEVHSLNTYLSANERIVRCKEAAVRVSP